MTKEDHKKYAEDLLSLSKIASEHTASRSLSFVLKLLNASKGNPILFSMLLKKSRKAMIAIMQADGIKASKQARSLGATFGELKANVKRNEHP